MYQGCDPFQGCEPIAILLSLILNPRMRAIQSRRILMKSNGQQQKLLSTVIQLKNNEHLVFL